MLQDAGQVIRTRDARRRAAHLDAQVFDLSMNTNTQTDTKSPTTAPAFQPTSPGSSTQPRTRCVWPTPIPTSTHVLVARMTLKLMNLVFIKRPCQRRVVPDSATAD